MRVKYWSKNKHPTWEERGLEFVQLDEMFSTCDIVTVHLSPYAPEKIINATLLSSLKNGAIFVNTSAGKLVDQEALFEELSKSRIFAFLDVYEGLPPRKTMKKINTFDNVFTYRSGWYTQEAITYKGEYLLKNIENYLEKVPQLPAWDVQLIGEDIMEIQCTSNNLKQNS